MKRVLFLGIFSFFSFLAYTQNAVQPPGSGTYIDPYLISSVDHLYWFSQTPSSWSSFFKQTCNIDASSSALWDGGKGWNAIDTFKGRYNGLGHTISGLYINRPDEDNQGFFGVADPPYYMYTGEILNLGIVNCNITGHNNTGALIGTARGRAKNCWSSGFVNGTGNCTGGLIGFYTSGTYGGYAILQCWSECNVSSTGLYTGGFVGKTDYYSNIIMTCYATGNVTSTSNYTGGFVGSCESSLIWYCYSRGRVDAPAYAGGFAASVYSVMHCYSTGAIVGNPTLNIGGFVEYSTYSLIYSFWDVNTSGTTYSYDGTPKTTLEMKTRSTYNEDWGRWFDTIYVINPIYNDGYPAFQWTIPLAPVALKYPSNGSIGQPLTPRLTWEYLRWSEEYRLEISTDEAFNNIIYNCRTVNLFKDIPSGILENNHVYYWRVKGIKVQGGDEIGVPSEVRSFRVISGAVATPVPSWPVGGATTYLEHQTLYWYLAGLDTGYTYQVELCRGYGDFEEHTGTLYTSTEKEFTIPFSLTGSTTYFWRVRAYRTYSDLYGAFSQTASFTTDASIGPVVPQISYPTNGSTVYSTSPRLYWYTGAAPQGLSFTVVYSTSPAFSHITWIYPLTNNYCDMSGLSPGTTYYWMVRSQYGFNYSNWSTPASFIVSNNTSGNPTIPVGSWPLGGTTTYTLQPTLYWYLNSYSAGLQYMVRFKKASDPEWSDTLTTDQLYVQTPVLLPGSDYQWQVQSFSGAVYSGWSDTYEFTTTGAISAPQIVFPASGSVIYTQSPVITWMMNSYTGLDHYILKLSLNSDLSDPVYTSGPLTESSLNLENLYQLTAGATYFIGITAYYSGSQYAESNTGWFTAAPGMVNPVTPLSGSPKNATVIGTTSPQLSWGIPVYTDGLSYNLQYSKNEDFSDATEINNISVLNCQIPNLQPGVKYYWRLRSVKNGQSSTYSAKSWFIPVDAATGINEVSNVIPEKFTVAQNYPNPFNPSTVISFGIPEKAFVSIKIYNMLGQEIVTLLSEERNAGTHNITWNGLNSSGSRVTSGTYIYKITAGSETISKKMLFVK